MIVIQTHPRCLWLVLGHCWGIGGVAPCGAKTGLYGAREGHVTLVGHTLGIVRGKTIVVICAVDRPYWCWSVLRLLR
jgi:hypothetical protein